jgi:membrane protein
VAAPFAALRPTRVAATLRGAFGLARAAVDVGRAAWRIFSGRGARFLGAAVAFYALLSAAPLFVVILYVVGLLFGRERAEGALWGGLSTWIEPQGLAALRSLTERVARVEGSSGIAGAALIVYGSTRLFRGLHRALNQLWGVDLERVERRRPGPLRYAVRYGGALLLTLLAAALVSTLLAVKAGLAFFATQGVVAAPSLLSAADQIASVVLAFVLFGALFRVLPEARVTLREAALCSLVSTPLFALGSALVSVYVRHKRLGDLYGGASAVVLAVVWAYYSAQVFFLGASLGAALRERADAALKRPGAAACEAS